MKTTLFATAFAVAAMTCAPAFAQVTGYADVSYSRASVEVLGTEGHADGMSLTGALAAPVGASLQVQAGLTYSDTNVGDDTFAGTVHLVGAPSEQTRLGGFLSAAEVGSDTGVAGGVEGQYGFDRVTLAGNVAYATVDGMDLDIWGVNTEARLFATDDFRIDGSLGWASADDGAVDVQAWIIGVGAEAAVAGPISVFVGYSHTAMDDIDLTADVATIGLRYNFGGSLKDRDRSGANFIGAQGLLSLASF